MVNPSLPHCLGSVLLNLDIRFLLLKYEFDAKIKKNHIRFTMVHPGLLLGGGMRVFFGGGEELQKNEHIKFLLLFCE